MRSGPALELRELVADLVAIDSVNPTLVEGGAGEEGMAGYVSAWLAAGGLEPRVDEAAPGRPNVVAVAHGAGGGPVLLLNAHMDTVGVAGMDRPFEAMVRDGRLYARGSADTKGGLAAAMWAVREAHRSGRLRGDVVLAAVCDEEAGSAGTEHLVAGGVRAAAAIVLEPTNLEIVVAHKGFVWVEITVDGRAAHGSRPDLGIDAIVKMGRVLVGLETLGARLSAGHAHPVLGTGSLHAGRIEGGQEASSYPQRCRVGVERRTIPGETVQTVRAEIEALLASAGEGDPQFSSRIDVGFSRDPLQTPPDERVVVALHRHARAVLGRDPGVSGFAGWTDAALLAAAGIPSVVFGPVGAGLHGVDEWVDLASVESCARVLLAVAGDVCG